MALIGCTYEKAEPLTVGCDSIISFRIDIVPILNLNCIGCHSTGDAQGDFQNYDGVKAKADNGILKYRVCSVKDMPVPPGSISDADRQKIKCWIEQGAQNN